MPLFFHARATDFGAYKPKTLQISSLSELFQNWDTVLKKIPENERWDMYFCTAETKTPRKKDSKGEEVGTWAKSNWIKCEALFFDIDKIDEKDIEKVDAYTESICAVTKVSPDDVTVVFSGHGYHFYFFLKEPITQWDYYRKNRGLYKEILSMWKKELKARGLSGEPDPAVFDHVRIMRMPGTENRKREPVKTCKLIQLNLTRHDMSLGSLLDIPVVPPDEELKDDDVLEMMKNVDKEAILNECNFMDWVARNPLSVKEPQGYAALSILARLDAEGILAKQYYAQWTNSTSLMKADPDAKIAHALEASGPRTCKAIEKLAWIPDGCRKCKHFEKVTTPLQVKGPNFIASEGTGFHLTVWRNDKRVRIPQPHDLRRFLEREGTYKVVSDKIIYRWNGKQYEELGVQFLPAYAEKHFNPHVKTADISEFVNVCFRYNLVDGDWFARSTEGLFNFQNGVVDFKTGQLTEHTPERGFQYVLPFNYDPAATAPRWEKFLSELFPRDPDSAALLEEFIGYCLSGDKMWAQKAMILLGDGANGKSTLIKVIQNLAGENNFSGVKLEQFNNPVYVQLLYGKLFNLAGETGKRGFAETSGIKELIGGDKVTARKLYSQAFFFENRAKIIFACNTIPNNQDATYGFYRRFWVLKFNQVFSVEKGTADVDIDTKLQAELPGIFNRVWRAYKAAKERKRFTESTTVKAALEEIRQDMDVVGTWIAENVVENPSAKLANKELYALFSADMEATGNHETLRATNSQKLINRVTGRFPGATRYHDHGERGYIGLALIPRGPASQKTP